VPTHPTTTVSVTVLRAGPLPAGTVAENWLSSPERARAERFHRPADRSRFVTGRALVRAVVADHLGSTAAKVDVRVHPPGSATPGRPFVPGAPSFSIAHSGEDVLVAIVRDCADTAVEVGVDVESTLSARDHLDDLLHAVPPGEQPDAGWTPVSFTRSWVRRAALLKAVGTGLLAPRDDLALGRADDLARVLRSGGMLPPPELLAVADLDLAQAPSSADRSLALAQHEGPRRRAGGMSPATGEVVPLGEHADREQHLAAVALHSPHLPVTLGDVQLTDGLAFLARHGLTGP
jgi:4'-phosphopantetheinyl transferase